MKGLLSANLKGYLGLCHQMGQINLLLCPRPLIKELGAVTKGRDYSGAGLLCCGVLGPTIHCTGSVGICRQQCISSRRQSDELWTDADRDTSGHWGRVPNLRPRR